MAYRKCIVSHTTPDLSSDSIYDPPGIKIIQAHAIEALKSMLIHVVK